MTNQTPYVPEWVPPKTSAWSRLKPVQRAGLIVAAILLPCCGGVAVVGAIAGGDPQPADDAATAARQGIADIAPSVEATTPEPAEPESAAQQTPEDTPESAQDEPAPVVEKRTVTERKRIRFKTRTVTDSSMAKGEKRVRTPGADGVRTLTYEVTYTNGKQTGRKLVKSAVTEKPVTKVVVVGTKSASTGGCDPNYTPCVPIASDVDCAGGSGNGPEYVDGPVRVVGSDPYELDRDGDGIACD